MVLLLQLISDEQFFEYAVLTLFLITPPTIFSLLFLTAPYGKHTRPGWGPTIPPPLAWCLMESPTVFLSLLLFPSGKNHRNPRAYLLLSFFLLHYTHRTFIYPLRLFLKTPNSIQSGSTRPGPSTPSKSTRPDSIKSGLSRPENQNPGSFGSGSTRPGFPVSIAVTAFVFNLLNGYLQARWVSEYADLDSDRWFWYRVDLGGVVFVGGMVVNIWADNVLMRLKESGGGYKVPKGGLFEWVTSPNYLGEMVEWLGWAFMCWSWAAFGFFLYTCANLVPRAVASRKWYLDKFGEEYPRHRKAVIPFLC